MRRRTGRGGRVLRMRSWLEHSAFAEVLLGGRGYGVHKGSSWETGLRRSRGRRQADGVRPGYGRRRSGRRCRLVRRYGGGRRCPSVCRSVCVVEDEAADTVPLSSRASAHHSRPGKTRTQSAQRKRSAAKTETEARGTTTVFAETPSKSGRPVRSIECLKSDLTGIRYGVYITNIINNLIYRNHRRHSFFSSSWLIIDELPVTNSPFAFRDIVLNGGPILPPGRLCFVRRLPLYLSTFLDNSVNNAGRVEAGLTRAVEFAAVQEM